MKRVILVALSAAALLLGWLAVPEAVKAGPEYPQDAGKIVVCHLPGGSLQNRQTLNVGASAVPAHLSHGDSLGGCPECLSDSECTAGEFCNTNVGACQDPNGPCDDDADCVNGQFCHLAGICLSPDGPCDDDTDCVNGQICNFGTGTCEAPATGCTGNADCAAGYTCDIATGECRP